VVGIMKENAEFPAGFRNPLLYPPELQGQP
jgi:hypothetical protein